MKIVYVRMPGRALTKFCIEVGVGAETGFSCQEGKPNVALVHGNVQLAPWGLVTYMGKRAQLSAVESILKTGYISCCFSEYYDFEGTGLTPIFKNKSRVLTWGGGEIKLTTVVEDDAYTRDICRKNGWVCRTRTIKSDSDWEEQARKLVLLKERGKKK